jgi:hypothetical protein
MSDPLLEAIAALPTRQRHFKSWLAEQPQARREAVLDAIYDGTASLASLETLLRDYGANVSSDTLGKMRHRGRPAD